MISFLSEQRRAELVQKFRQLKSSQEDIDQFTSIPDDLDEVDIVMTNHVLAVALCRRDGEPKAAAIGLVCLLAIMEEARSRGLGENDFPMSLSVIQHELAEHYSRNTQ